MNQSKDKARKANWKWTKNSETIALHIHKHHLKIIVHFVWCRTWFSSSKCRIQPYERKL